MGSTIDLYEARLAGSAYYALNEDANYVLAGRLAVGFLGGAPLASIPDSHRFFSGGGSVRGFGFNTISPMMVGQIIGGRSLIEGSAEVRIKVTPTIGSVPFIDFGTASSSSLPNFNDYGFGRAPVRVNRACPRMWT